MSLSYLRDMQPPGTATAMLSDTTLVLLAGGLNTRLRRLLRGASKTLIAIDRHEPLLARLIEQFLNAQAKVIVVADQHTHAGFSVTYPALASAIELVCDEYSGTGRALHLGIERASTGRIIAANADTIVPCNLVRWCHQAPRFGNVVQLLLPNGVQNSGLIGLDIDTGKVEHWGEVRGTHPPSDLLPMSSTGVYSADRSWWLQNVPSGVSSLERELLPDLVARGQLSGYACSEQLPAYDFGTEDRLRQLFRNDNLRFRLLVQAGIGDVQPTLAPL